MKISYSILSLLLCMLCIAYLFFYPQRSFILSHNCSAVALAREDNHNTLSNARPLSLNTAYQEHIAANDTRYYCISFQKKLQFQITSDSLKKLKISLISDIGTNISFRQHTVKSRCTYIPNISPQNSIQRIFLRLVNHSSGSCSFQLKTLLSKSNTSPQKKKKTPVSKNITHHNQSVTIQKPRITPSHDNSNHNSTKNNNATIKSKTIKPKTYNKTTSNPKKEQNNTASKKLSTTRYKNTMLYPQFISIKPGFVKKLTFKPRITKNKFLWLSSNSSVASVTDGKIHAIKEGITIIYLQEKNHPANTSSCFVRVIEGD